MSDPPWSMSPRKAGDQVFHLPNRLSSHVQSVVWTIGRQYGFQAFNETKVSYNDQPEPATSATTPVASSIILAGDHLSTLVGAQYARLYEARYQQTSSVATSTPERLEDVLFHQALLHVHSVLFESYVLNWCPLVKLRPLPHKLAMLQHTSSASSWTSSHSLLSQLSLYMLIWVEGANIRHMGEATWFLFWCLVHTPSLVSYASSTQTPEEPHSYGHSPWRLRCRTLCARALADARRASGLALKDPELCLVPPAAAHVEGREYLEASKGIRREMQMRMEQNLPAGTVAQLAEELVKQYSGTSPVGLPLHLLPSPQPQVSKVAAPIKPTIPGAPPSNDVHLDDSQEQHDQRDGAAMSMSGGSCPLDMVQCEQLVWDLLLDLALYGDGGWVVDRLITPLFLLLAHEMDVLSSEDPCHRLGYDDVNESLCRHETIHRCLEKLGISKNQIKAGDTHTAYAALTIYLAAPPNQKQTQQAQAPAGGAGGGGAAHRPRMQAHQPTPSEVVNAAVEAFPCLVGVADAGLLTPGFDAQRVQVFWSLQVNKTFVETRSWWVMFKVFWRVWALNLLCLHLATVLAFYGPNLLALSSLVPAHALLVALGRVANAFTVRNPSPSALQQRAREDLKAYRKKTQGMRSGSLPSDPTQLRLLRPNITLEGAPLLKFGGWLESVVIALGITCLYVYRLARPKLLALADPLPYVRLDDVWYMTAAVYACVKALHWGSTIADGFTRSLLDSFFLPSWLVNAYSCRPRARHHLSGRLGLGCWTWLLQGLSFTAAYIVKFAFEYFVICKPMVKPVHALLSICWPCLPEAPHMQLNWLLVVLRYSPALLLCQIDGMLAYHLLLSAWTLFRGVVFRDLVNLHNWDGGELARDFHAAPARWWAKCMSAPARAHQLIHAARSAHVPPSASPGQDTTSSHKKHQQPLTRASPAPSTPSIASSSVGHHFHRQSVGGTMITPHGMDMHQKNSPTSITIEVHKSGAALASERLACAQWRAFTTAWDCLLTDLRASDLLNDAETIHLSLHDTAASTAWLGACLMSPPSPSLATHSPGLPTATAGASSKAGKPGASLPAPASSAAPWSMAAMEELLGGPERPSGLLGPVLLPGMVHEGMLQQLVDGGGGGASSMQTMATLRQLRGVGVTLLVGCGFLSVDEALVLAKLGVGWRAVPRVTAHQEARQASLAAAQQLAGLLNECCAHDDDDSKPTNLTAIAPKFVAAFKNVLKGLEVECRAARAQWFAPPILDTHLQLLTAVQQRITAMPTQHITDCLTRLHPSPSSPLDTSHAAPRTPSHHSRSQSYHTPPIPPARHKAAHPHAHAPASGVAQAGSGARTHGTSAVVAGAQRELAAGSRLLVGHLQVLLSANRVESKPRSKDARRALTAFLNSLAMDSLTSAPSLISCPSLCTLTPVYHEDVVYALEAKRVVEKHLSGQTGDGPKPTPIIAAPSTKATKDESAAPRGRHARSMSAGDGAGGAAGVVAPMAGLKAELAALTAGLPDLLTEGASGEGDDGASVSLITYLITIFGQEFDNFKERIARKAGLPPAAAKKITPHDFAAGGVLAEHGLELQLWASYRGQLLARTVRGMECYHKACQVLAALEHPSAASTSGAATSSSWMQHLVMSKFQHIVSAQVYGAQRKSKDLRDRWNAQGVELLLRRHPALRVAYVDASGVNQPSYSVLLRATSQGVIEEVYRVRLPANPYSGRGVIIGEGKPENQNHAIIFCISEAVQTIDANQDNTVSEALKVCNVLKELGLHGSSQHAEMLGSVSRSLTCEKALFHLWRAKDAHKTTALVGLREWIFSNRVGALGGFAASTEYAFSTVIQRGMAAGGVRLHYGHPDVFNRAHVMTRGGLSKATRGLHVSEDVFAGLAHLGRGAQIKHCEHSSVGKGRDMGLDSIMGFETKISAGNAQVFLSRDLARLAPRLDLPRVLHFYYSGLGYFPTAIFTVMAVTLQLLTSTALALAGVATVSDPNSDSPVPILYGTPLAILTGLVSNLPWVAQTILDEGLLQTTIQTLQQLLSGSLMFFAFRMQTTALHFATALTYPGGASYIATGRGFAYQARSFVHLCAQYGRSHLQPGLGLLALLLAIAMLLAPADYTVNDYAALTWPMWLHAVSLLMAPFWFTPECFSWSKLSDDWASWKRWQLAGERDASAQGSWATWNRRELERVRNWHGRQTNTLSTSLLGLALNAIPPALLAFLAVLQLLNWGLTGQLLCASVGLWLLFALTSLAKPFIMNEGHERHYWQFKVVRSLLVPGTAIGYTVALAVILGSYGALPLLYTLILHSSVALLAHRVVLHTLPPLRTTWLVDSGWWVQDVAAGGFLLCLLSVLSVGGILSSIQTTLIFNSKYVDVARGGKLASILAKRKGGLGAAAGETAATAAGQTAGGFADAAGHNDAAAAAVLEDAAEAVEREVTAELILSRAGGRVGAALNLGMSAAGGTAGVGGSAGRPAGRRLASWLRGGAGQGEDGDVERGSGGTIPPPSRGVYGGAGNKHAVRTVITQGAEEVVWRGPVLPNAGRSNVAPGMTMAAGPLTRAMQQGGGGGGGGGVSSGVRDVAPGNRGTPPRRGPRGLEPAPGVDDIGALLPAPAWRQ